MKLSLILSAAFAALAVAAPAGDHHGTIPTKREPKGACPLGQHIDSDLRNCVDNFGPGPVKRQENCPPGEHFERDDFDQGVCLED